MVHPFCPIIGDPYTIYILQSYKKDEFAKLYYSKYTFISSTETFQVLIIQSVACVIVWTCKIVIVQLKFNFVHVIILHL